MLTTSINSDDVIAVSGGIDSIACAFILRYKIKTLYHFNHKLRPQNEEMERKVRKFAAKFGFDLIVESVERKIKNEDQCRKARIDGIFNGRKNVSLITCHHLDDFVESYLLNCLRGKSEYFPIKFVTEFSNGNKIKHPFLLHNRDKFKSIVDRNGLNEFIEDDDTNLTIVGSRRNFLRLSIIPLLRAQDINLRKSCRKMILKKLLDNR